MLWFIMGKSCDEGNQVLHWGMMEKGGKCRGLPGARYDAAVHTSMLEVLSVQLSEVSVISPENLKCLAMSG